MSDDQVNQVEERSTGSTPPDAPNDPNERRLYPEDQARVDEFLRTGVNSVERKPFRPLYLLILLIGTVTVLSLLSQGLAMWAGVY